MRLGVSEFGFLGIRVSLGFVALHEDADGEKMFFGDPRVLRLASVHTRLRSDARSRRLECGWWGVPIGFRFAHPRLI